MKILCVGSWWPANAYRYLVDAFARNGHDVIRVGPTYNDGNGIAWSIQDQVHPERELSRNEPHWNLDEFVDWCTIKFGPPDLLLVTEENYQTDITPTARIASVLISYDGWPNSFARRELFQPTVAFTNHPFGIRIHPLKETPAGWEYLPGASAPWIHINRGYRRNYKFVLMATMYGQRPILCEALAKHFGQRSVIYGMQETRFYVHSYNVGLTTYVNANGQQEVKWRAFESFAMGCLVIADHADLYARLGYQPWVHYVPCETVNMNGELWPTVEELILHIELIERDSALQEYIRNNAMALTKERHTYFHRTEQILNALK